MNFTKAFIFFIMISVLLMTLHFVVIYFNASNEIPVLYNLYGFTYLIGIPVFIAYLFIQKNYTDYLGTTYLFLNGLKFILMLLWVLYLIDSLQLNSQHAFTHFMITSIFFVIAEIFPLFRLLKHQK